MKAKVTLKYEEKEYTFVDDWENEECNDFMWTEGNWSCDCNKSLFITRQCDEAFPEMDCGDTIELVSLEWVK